MKIRRFLPPLAALLPILALGITVDAGTSLAEYPTVPIPLPAIQAEQIERYDVDLTVQRDGVLLVHETIAYNFGQDSVKHGIYRDIPVFLSGEGGARKLHISMLRITNEEGTPYNVETSYENGMRRSKIGDADVTVSGVHVYDIRYTATRATVQASDVSEAKQNGHDFLLWNAIGTGWSVPILASTTTLRVEGAASSPFVTCVTGAEGSEGSAAGCSVSREANSATVSLATQLAAYEGLTIQARWPSGTTTYPTGLLRFLERYGDDWGVAAFFLIAIGLLSLYVTYGRDAAGRGVIIPEYDVPADLNVAEMGVIMDETAHNRDLTALVVDLAARGYLRITEIGSEKRVSDYTFTKLRDADEKLDPLELKLYERLFRDGPEVAVSELKQKMADTWTSIRSSIYSGLASRGYFRGNPAVIRGVTYGVGGAFGVAGFAAAIAGLSGVPYTSILTGAGLLLAGILTALSARAFPSRTAKGVAAREHIRGLKRYLSIAEKERMAFEEAEHRYSMLLPAALALGVAAKWTARFSGLLSSPPDWYKSTSSTFNPLLFSHSLASFASTTGSSLSSPQPSSSGGGGGVGGGGGGGGGGSW